jgi:uncharacterized membrane protein
MLACAFDYGSAIFRRPEWKTVGFWTLTAAAVVSVATVLSGLTGQNGWFGVEKWTAGAMENHRNIAIFASVLAILLALWRIVRRDNLKGTEWLIYLLCNLIATVAVGYTGFLGAYVARGY